MNLRILGSFLWQYRVNFSLLVLTISVGFFLMVFLLNISQYKDYYFEYKYGSVPEWIVLDTKHTEQDFHEKLLQSVDDKDLMTGKYMKLEELAFQVEGHDLSYIAKDVYLFGFDISKELKVDVLCGQARTSVSVDKIYSTHATRWKIKTSGLEDMSCDEEIMQLVFKQHKVDVDVKRKREHSSVFEFDPKKHNSEAFYGFLISITKYYMKAFRPGRKNSISSQDKADIDLFTSRYKEPLENFFALIFSQGMSKSLSSEYLSNQISNYDHVSQRYSITSGEESAELVIRDVINFPIEQSPRDMDLSNSIFMKGSVLPEFRDVKQKGNFAFIYSETILDQDNGLVYLSKERFLPQYKEQKEFVRSMVYMGIAMVSFYIFIILSIALTRFYSVYGKDIFLLKIYSSSILVFIQIIVIALLVSTLISYVGLVFSFDFINTILMQYYQPIMHFDTSYLWQTLLYSSIAIGLLMGIEYLIWRRLWISIK